MRFHDLALEVGCGAKRISQLAGGRVLQHDGTRLVVGVSQCEGLGGQRVEEALLGAEVILDRLVIVQMIAGEVGEDAGGVVQSGDALLIDRMRAHLHEDMRTPGLCHASDQRVQCDGVGRRVVGGQCLLVDAVADGGDESHVVA